MSFPPKAWKRFLVTLRLRLRLPVSGWNISSCPMDFIAGCPDTGNLPVLPA